MLDFFAATIRAIFGTAWLVLRVWMVFIILTVGLSLLSSKTMQPTQPAYTGDRCEATPTIVTTRVFNLLGGQGTGFGVRGYVVSNDHVVGFLPLVIMVDENWRFDLGWVRAKARDESNTAAYTDLAVIEPLFGTLTVNPLPLANSAEHETVYTRGFPRGNLSATYARQWPTEKHNVLDTDLTVTSGASGSPVVNCRGEVVGVIATQMRVPTFMTPDETMHVPPHFDTDRLDALSWVFARGGIWLDNGAVPVARLHELLATLDD